MSGSESGQPATLRMEGCTWTHVDDVAPVQYAPGITLRPLYREESGRWALVVDLAPGTVWPTVDVHESGPEAVFVVTGVLNDGVRDHPAGTFLHSPKGSSHHPRSDTGCRLLVFYPDG